MDLSVFEGKALAEALTRSGHSVSEKTVQRWKAGTTAPKPQDIAAIRRLLDMPAQQKAAPRIGERLDEIEILMRAIAAVSGVDLKRVETMRRELLAALRARQRGAASRKAGPRGQGK